MPLTGKQQRSVSQFIRKGFAPHFDQLPSVGNNRLWRLATEAGSEIWLDTGSILDVGHMWVDELTALTTNNTLLNAEIQAGAYDALVPEAAALLADADLTDRERLLELAFILNAVHGLRLVENFDAFVSVEEHTDLANDMGAAIATARRYFAICPERFIVKIPLTPAGLLAARQVVAEGIPVNFTLGFSARQNYLAARIAKPAFVNIFMGRLNAFVSANDLGDGESVGEKALMASQKVVRELREVGKTDTRQIAASIRDDKQVANSIGTDVLTVPVKSAKQFLWPGPDEVVDRTQHNYQPTFADGVDPAAAGLNTLWDVPDSFVACVDALEAEDLDAFSADDLVSFFHDQGCGDHFPRWTDEQVTVCAAEGKIPKLDTWRDDLASGAIGLDALMNLAGLLSFTADQKAMDDRVAGLL